MAVLACILCGNRLEERTSKKRKPYFVCDRCGMQIFIRRKEGIENLAKLCRNLEENAILYAQYAKDFDEIRAVLKEIDDLQQEIDNLRISHIFSLERSRIREALLQRKENALLRLETIAQCKGTEATK